MQEINIIAKKRESSGKGGARKLRAQGRIPAVFYSKAEEVVPVDIEAQSFEFTLHHLESENVLVNLQIDGQNRKAILRDVQHDPIDNKVLHADFYGIAVDQEIHLDVPLHFLGTAAGIKEGCILQAITRQLEISCRADHIPDSIEVDVSLLMIGDSIHVRDLNIQGVNILTSPDSTIVTLVPPTITKAAVVEEAVVEGEEEASKEPEVITEKKREEEPQKGSQKHPKSGD